MDMKFKNNILVNVRNHETKYVVYVLMANYNVWHKHTETPIFDVALKECERLEKMCNCFTEIREVKTENAIIRRYEYIKE